MNAPIEVHVYGKKVTVQKGESIESIAFSAGLRWQTVWEHPENAKLRELRPSPHQLVAGDDVFVPAPKTKSAPCQTGRTNTFQYRSASSRLRLVLQEHGKPLADVPYVVQIDHKLFKGRTGADGLLECPLSPDALQARIRIGDGIGARFMTLQLRTLQPVTELAGVQARLQNLGYGPGPADGTNHEQTVQALRRFQTSEGLDPDGKLTDSVRTLLVKRHGS